MMLACLILGLFIPLMAQSKVLSGRVTDYNGDPLVGAHVKVTTGKQVATATDQDGRYELRLPSVPASTQVKVEFSYVGYVPQVIALSRKQQSSEKLNVRLQEDFASLDQVVVTGTRTPRRSRMPPSSPASSRLRTLPRSRPPTSRTCSPRRSPAWSSAMP